MNRTALRVCRMISLLISALLCCSAVILLTIGVATPLYVDYLVAEGTIEEHRHGLWLDCVLRGGGGSNPYAQSSYLNWGVTSDQCEYKWVNIGPSSYGSGGAGIDPYLSNSGYTQSSYLNWGVTSDQCEYKWVNIGPSSYGNGGAGIDPYLSNSGYSAMSSLFQTDYSQHRFLAWHVSTLILLLIAITAGVFAIFACLCVLCTGLCSPVAALLEFVAFISSAIGVTIFFVNANRPEIRYTQIPNSAERWRVNEQMRGFSFDLSLASVFIFLLSCLLGVLGSVVVFMHAQQHHQRHRRMDSKTFPKTEISTVSSTANDHNHNHLNMTTNMANQPHLIRIRNDGTGGSVIRDNSIDV
uniref:MARVEL domain-containing protein n=1 Tax=Globodera pallida TaxID=36090 RepID=A0A183BZF2_GLOPA